jgi:ubiquinone/menaquinone biosynthesis C-methylase UbiE
MINTYTERFSLRGWTPPWLRYEHLTRYEWVREFTRGRRVIDAASGTGYGSEMIARTGGATGVEGFDISQEAVADAVAAFGSRQGLSYRVADATCLPVEDGSYDVYVCFETIEHVQEPDRLLAEARRVLRRPGKFVVSTPNRDVVAPGTSLQHRPFNPAHVREYNRAELEALLAQFFPAIAWFGQSPCGRRYVAGLNRLGRHWPKLPVRLHQLRKSCQALWRTREFHRPRAYDPAAVPEVLIAVCEV